MTKLKRNRIAPTDPLLRQVIRGSPQPTFSEYKRLRNEDIQEAEELHRRRLLCLDEPSYTTPNGVMADCSKATEAYTEQKCSVGRRTSLVLSRISQRRLLPLPSIAQIRYEVCGRCIPPASERVEYSIVDIGSKRVLIRTRPYGAAKVLPVRAGAWLTLPFCTW